MQFGHNTQVTLQWGAKNEGVEEDQKEDKLPK